MSEPITITATIPAWLTSHSNPTELVDALNAGNSDAAINCLRFISHDMSDASWIRMGTAKITVEIESKDACVAAAVTTLQAALAKEKAESFKRQQAILAQISKLQALTYEAAA